jgi:four helix bundle protein
MSNSFKDIKAWQFAHQFVIDVYKHTREFPETERFGLCSQFQRAAVSIAANIAEGYKKLSKPDKLRFLNISQGSLEECRYYILLSKDLGYINSDSFENLDAEIEKVSWYINAYCKGILNNNAIADYCPHNSQ